MARTRTWKSSRDHRRAHASFALVKRARVRALLLPRPADSAAGPTGSRRLSLPSAALAFLRAIRCYHDRARPATIYQLLPPPPSSAPRARPSRPVEASRSVDQCGSVSATLAGLVIGTEEPWAD